MSQGACKHERQGKTHSKTRKVEFQKIFERARAQNGFQLKFTTESQMKIHLSRITMLNRLKVHEQILKHR